MDDIEIIKRQLESMKCPFCGGSVKVTRKGKKFETATCGHVELEALMQTVLNPQKKEKD